MVQFVIIASNISARTFNTKDKNQRFLAEIMVMSTQFVYSKRKTCMLKKSQSIHNCAFLLKFPHSFCPEKAFLYEDTFSILNIFIKRIIPVRNIWTVYGIISVYI